MPNHPVFTKHNDGRVTVDRWTPEIIITRELIDQADPGFLRMEGDDITISVANGHAAYRVTSERRLDVDAVHAVLVASEGPDA